VARRIEGNQARSIVAINKINEQILGHATVPAAIA
jgi:hypothetical protein